jgi:hypothetical protein
MQRHLSFAALLRLSVGCQDCSMRQPGSPTGSPTGITPHFYSPHHYYSQRKRS